MSYKKPRHSLVHLPRIPYSKNPAVSQEEFWQLKEKSGAINAFRQLNSTLRRGGRKVTALPGGKLQPLFRNYSYPENATAGLNSALPVIPGVSSNSLAAPKQILSGSLKDLPPLSPTTVRIYVCSNYEDMKHERVQLLKAAVPDLQDYCSDLGLQFQLVDLHWGMNGVEQSQAAGGWNREIRNTEISDCQRLSVGPHFVCLLGDRYGMKQLPNSLTEGEYKILYDVLQENIPLHSDLMTKYYVKDENSLPPCFVYQKPEQLSELDALHRVILEAIKLSVSQNKLTSARAEELTMSALEEDIRQGILDTKDPRSHCLCYHREFRDIASNLSQFASEYVDTVTDESGRTKLDTDLKYRVTKLAESVMGHLGIGNFHSYYLSWTDRQLDNELEFQSYLKRLTEDFVKDIKEMISAGYKLVKKEISAKRSISSMILQEALFHMHKCKMLIGHYTRSKETSLFSKLKAFLNDPIENSRPFIIWGESGTGKTTTAAVIAEQLKTWFGDDCVVVIRFLGSTWQSASIHQTIRSVTLQICLAYGLQCSSVSSDLNTLHESLVTFRSVLDLVSKTSASSHPLFIILDAIDQLQPFQQSLKALWAMRDFPPNVHMIVSTIPKLGDLHLLGALTSTISTPSAVMEVPSLDMEEIKTFTEGFMMKSRRHLSKNQQVIFTETITKHSQPLYIAQLMLKAMRLHSKQEVNSNLPTTVEGLFVMQLQHLEQEIGKSIVKYFVAFITASPVGVTECELLDLLTNNKEAMAEVFALHHQPSEAIFLFPPNLLIKMKYALRDFLCENSLLGRLALAWTHREVYQAASDYYDVIYPGIADMDIAEGMTDFSLMLHEQFTNMFLPESRTHLLSEPPDEIICSTKKWMVLNQPQKVCVENVQKLHRAPLHLSIMAPMEGLARIKQIILFNFNWLYVKLQSAGLAVVLQDVIDVLLLVKGLVADGVLEVEEENIAVDSIWKEIDLLYHFLQLAAPALSQDVHSLPVEILGRLLPLQTQYPGIGELVKEAKEYLSSCQGPCIIPLSGCLPSPGMELRHTFSGVTHVLGYRETSRSVFTFSQKSGVRIWHLDSMQLLQHFPVNKEQDLSGILPGHDGPFIIIGHYSHLNHVMQIGVWSMDSGVTVLDTTLPHRFEALALSLDDQIIFLATVSYEQPKTNGESIQRYILGIKAKTKEIICTLPCNDYHSDGVRRIIPIGGMRDGSNCLITLGGRKAKDLIYWDVDEVTMDYHIQFNHFLDMFTVSEEQGLGVGCCVDEGVLLVVDLRNGVVEQTIQETSFQDMQDVYLSNSGDFIVMATAQVFIIVYSILEKNERKLKRLGVDQKLSKVTMDEMETLLFIGHHGGIIEIYSFPESELLSTLSSHTKTINTLHVLPNESLLSASNDNELKLWHYGMAVDSAAKKMVDTVRVRSVCCLSLTKNDTMIVTGSYNGPIQIWDINSPDEPSAEITENCEHGLTELYMAYKGKLIIGHCIRPDLPNICALQVWNFDSGLPVSFDKEADVLVFTSCIFPSDDRILTISPSTDERQKGIIVAIFDLFEMKCVASLQCNIYSSMDSTNLRLLGFTMMSEENDMELESINDSETSLTQMLHLHSSRLYAVLDYFPSEGLSFFFTFVVHGEDMKDISMDHHEPIHLDTVSPKCNVIMPNNICVSGTKVGSLVVWNVASQTVISNFCDTSSPDHLRRQRHDLANMHTGPVTCMAPAPDRIHIVSGGVDGKIKVWNLKKKTLVHTFSRHLDQITHISVSNENLITSASMDQNITVWNLETKQYLCGFFAHDYVTDVTMTTDRSRLVAKVNKKHPALLVLKLTGL